MPLLGDSEAPALVLGVLVRQVRDAELAKIPLAALLGALVHSHQQTGELLVSVGQLVDASGHRHVLEPGII